MNTKAKFLILDNNDKTVGTASAACGEVCVINGLPLGKYKLVQYAAPRGLCPSRSPYYFELEHPCCTRIIKIPAGVCYDDCAGRGGEWGFDDANVAIKVQHNCGRE